MPSVMPVSRSTHRGIGVPGSSSASKARWMVPPSRMATATSRIRPPTWARTPVVSTSTTAKRACSMGSDAGLEVIPSERQGHAPGTAATAHQLAAVHRDHRPVAVVQPLLSRQQALGGHRFEPRMLELAQGRLVAGVGHGQAGPHREEIAGRGPLRSEEHTSELQSRQYLVCRLLLEKKIILAVLEGIGLLVTLGV